MKKMILLLFSMSLMTNVKSQIIYDGYDMDSSFMTFDTLQIEDFVTDSSTIWQIGNTAKPFFSQNLPPVRSIMTDTINSYAINSNSWFQIAIPAGYSNVIVNFVHKYQTDSFHDGCIVEFSTDTGAIWENIKGDCNVDGTGTWNGILTENLYSKTDTLLTGEMAFSGVSNDWIHSRIQFLWGFPIKSTDSTNQCNMSSEIIHMRFRFISDNTTDTLDGWIIDSIKIEHDGYSSVKDLNNKVRLKVYPNPSSDGHFYFPELVGENKMEIINSIGQMIYSNTYQRKIDLSAYPKGLYFYRVIGDTDRYSGQILLE